MWWRQLSYLLLALVLSTSALAATLTGTVYTQDLQIAKYTLMTINTTPQQRIILEEGTYNITVPRGTYLIRMEQNVSGRVYDDELVVDIKDTGFVRNTGNYTYDFILFPGETNTTAALPSLPAEESEIIEAAETNGTNTSDLALLITIVILLGAATAFFVLRKKKEPTMHKEERTEQPNAAIEELPADLDTILRIVKKEGGRTTQKDLRKHIACSEAKLSMMITELEAKGKIQKIKKGRGNILILR